MDRAKSIVSKNDKSRAERKVRMCWPAVQAEDYQGTSQRDVKSQSNA